MPYKRHSQTFFLGEKEREREREREVFQSYPQLQNKAPQSKFDSRAVFRKVCPITSISSFSHKKLINKKFYFLKCHNFCFVLERTGILNVA
jgi:hypothetical protein